jgi:hypothetical protein
MMRGFFIDGHASLTLIPLSLLYRLVNIPYNRSLFLLLITFCCSWLRLVPLCYELLYILGFDLYTVYYDSR